MEIAVAVVFFAAVVLLGLCRGFRGRSRRENVFYILCIGASLTIVLIKSIA